MFQIGFSLYERAWTLRGMENLLVDFHDHPKFVRDLFDRIADYNVAQVREIAELKAPDLNSATVEAAERMVLGTARSMGIELAD